MAVKNTRHWQIPAAPGPRSSLSGQFSAVHPRLNYQERPLPDGTTRDFREGGGLPESSMRLFWLIMAYAYKGLFNGSEMLNALELTKRMAWQFGGVAQSLGIQVEPEQ
jgi:CRISPR-associated protein Cmr2